MDKYETGYYWVKWGVNSKYPENIIAEFDGNFWTTCGSEWLYSMKEFLKENKVLARALMEGDGGTEV